jgi:pimeloyl-ACP methyl ester carboxylesterase
MAATGMSNLGSDRPELAGKRRVPIAGIQPMSPTPSVRDSSRPQSDLLDRCCPPFRRLGQITCPTLVVHCRGDAVIPLKEGRLLASSIAGARFEPLDSQNHFPLAGEPAFERVFDLLREFLPPV